MYVTIRGKRWKLELDQPIYDYGVCDPPDAPNKRIRIKKGMSDQDELSTIIHEVLHAAYWDLDEEAIDTTADDLARILRRLGYRR